MKLQMYSVFDSAVEAFTPPFFMRNKGEALRSFTDACTDGKSQFCNHPSDYTLFLIASFDDASGVVIPEATPMRIIGAWECVSVVENTTRGNGGQVPPPDLSIVPTKGTR